MPESKIETKQKFKLLRRKRIGRFGQLYIDKRVEGMQDYHEPDWSETLPCYSEAGNSEESPVIKAVQEQVFGDVYVFNDSEREDESVPNQFKSLSVGFRNYARRKKRQVLATPTSSLVKDTKDEEVSPT